MTDELLLKYISGQATEKEIRDVHEWASNSEEYMQELSRMKNIWILAGLDNELDPVKKEQEIRRILTKVRALNQKARKSTLRLKWLKYAAVIFVVIGLSGSSGYFLSQSQIENLVGYTEIIVPRGERSGVVLPDGSTVQLNGGSNLKFEPSFRNAKRMVVLEGEAFFDVAHDQSRPFIVEAAGLQVEVLGTRFNVASYPEDRFIIAYLESGKVKIDMEGQNEVFLKPSEAVEFDKTTGEFQKITQTDQRLTDWTKGILTVKGETIEILSKRLERRFDINILFGDDEVRNHLYTGSIRDEDLITVLDALKFASSLNYKKEGKIVTLYSK
jgi:ferric-dicitrate binding protein FerR (iron transport regulator)